MDIEALQAAIENEENLSIINTNIQEIKKKKNEILQELGLKRDDLKSFHVKLKEHRYIDDIKDLKHGSNIRWINLNRIDNIKLTNGAILCEIKILQTGLALILKAHTNQYFTIYLNANLIFQRINAEEKLLLKVIDHLNK